MGARDWTLEMLVSVVALAAPLAMVGTLLPHAGQPLPQWRYGVSVNTLLSIYAVVFKTALLFVLSNCILQLQWAGFTTPRPLKDLLSYDQASRGVLGSAIWLFSYHLREPAMSVAALLTITSLAIDPFAQQLVQHVDCQSSLGDMNATLPRTSSLMDMVVADDFFFGRWATQAACESSVSTTMTSSLTCATGNCTFPEYTTLGYCSQCSDLSDTMTFAAKSSKKVNENTNQTTVTEFVYTTAVRWPEPGDSVETILYDSSNTEFTSSLAFLRGGMGSYRLQREDGRKDYITSDSDVEILMPGNWFTEHATDPNTGLNITGCDANHSPPSWRCRGYGAARCSLHKCVRAYTATVVDGRLNEELVASSAGVYWGGNPDANPGTEGSGLVDTACLTPAQRQQLDQSGRLHMPNKTETQRFLRYTPLGWNTTADDEQNSNSGFHIPTELAPLDAELVTNGCLFLAFQGVNPDLSFNLLHMLREPPVTARGWFTGTPINVKPNNSASFDLNLVRATSYQGAPLLLSIWNGGNVSFSRVESAFSSLSESLTAYVRTNGDKGNVSAPARGYVHHYAVCLNVRWTWIALPAALWVSMAALLAFVALSASAARRPLWKSSEFLLGWIYRGPRLFSNSLGPRIASMKKQANIDFVVLEGGRRPRIRAVSPVRTCSDGGNDTSEQSSMLSEDMPRDNSHRKKR